MFKRLALFGACIGMLGFPGVASAGCIASPGKAFWNPANSAIQSFSAISCTTNNGPSYQERVYLQTDEGGWHSLAGVPAKSWSFVYPSGLPNGFADDRLFGNWICQSIAPAAVHARIKTVVENMITGSTSVAAGLYFTLASGCHY